MSHPNLANVIFRPSKMKLVLDEFLFQMAQQEARNSITQPYLDSVNFPPSKMKRFLVPCPNPNDSFNSFYIPSFCFIEK